MRVIFVLFFSVLLADYSRASEMISRIEDNAREHVKLERIFCSDEVVNIKGRSRTNKNISAFMRALHAEGFTPELISIESRPGTGEYPALFFMRLSNSKKMFPRGCAELPQDYPVPAR